jgi:hypothetical protein
MRSDVVATVVAVLLVLGSAGIPLAVATPSQPTGTASETASTAVVPLSTASSTAHDNRIRMTTTLNRTSKQPGEITTTVSFQFPSQVTELTARIPEKVTVTGTDGFEQDTKTAYDWDRETETPTVTFSVDPTRRTTTEGPLAEDGQYLFAASEDWALVRIPSTGARWRSTGSGELEFSRETEVDGPGAAGERMAFLGAHRIETRTMHGQTFRLVVPETAVLDEPAGEILDSLGYASNVLRIGDRDPEVFIVAAPTDTVGWGVRGLQIGPADMWVQDTERLDTPTNVWVHEYVHTRQDYETTAETRWVTEASATYYAALLSLEQGHIEFDQFRRLLSQGEAEPQSKAVLSRPSSWQNNAEYRKGPLVVGEIDRQIRLTTDRESSFETVFQSLNSHETAVSRADFEQYVTEAADSTVGDASTRYTTTDVTLEMWSSRTHSDAFGQLPARISFELAGENPVRITGPDRSESVSGTAPTLVEGDTLTVDMIARNVGGTVGEYELSFRVNESKTTATGRLEPNETATHQFEQTFTEPGEYTVSVGDERFEVRVREAETVPDESSTVDVELPGFGVIPAIGALLLIGLVATWRRRFD